MSIPFSQPDVSIIIVSWNTRDLLMSCLASLHAAVGNLNAEIWVVDNCSADGTVDAVLAGYPQVNLIRNPTNMGFAAANNQAIRAGHGRYVLLLNSDTVACPHSIDRVVYFADQYPAAGIIGPMLLNPDGSYQGSFANFPSLASEWLSVTGLGPRLFYRDYPAYGPRYGGSARPVGYVSGACMLVRRTAIEQVGEMDENYFMYSEEVDWCWRMRQLGWQRWYVPEAKVVHYGGQSTRQIRHTMVRRLYSSKVRFFRTHYGWFSASLLQGVFVVTLRIKWMLQRLIVLVQPRSAVGPLIRWRDLNSV